MQNDDRSIGAEARKEALAQLGNRLRRARLERQMSQISVADFLKVSTQTIRNWEGGRTEPKPEYIQRLAVHYDVQPEMITNPNRNSPIELFTRRMRYNRIPVNGTKLLAAREEARLTQTEASAKIGIGKSALGRYEKGKANPTPDTVEKLANLYGKTPDWFAPMSRIVGSHRIGATDADAEGEGSPIIQAYRDAQADLTDEDEEQIADFIRFIHSRRNARMRQTTGLGLDERFLGGP